MQPGGVVIALYSPKGRYMGADGIEGVWKFDTSGGQELGPHAFSAAVYVCKQAQAEKCYIHTTSAGRGKKKVVFSQGEGPWYSCLLTACLK